MENKTKIKTGKVEKKLLRSAGIYFNFQILRFNYKMKYRKQQTKNRSISSFNNSDTYLPTPID